MLKNLQKPAHAGRPWWGTLAVALAVCLAYPASAADVLLLRNPPRVVEAISVTPDGDCFKARLTSGQEARYCAAEVDQLAPGTTFAKWRDSQLATLARNDYDGQVRVLCYTLAAGLEEQGKTHAAELLRTSRGNPFLGVAASRGSAALDPACWIAFRYTEDIEQWVSAEGEDTPRYTVSVEQFRHDQGFHLKDGNHGMQILGTYFFERERGVSPVLLEGENSYPRGWPTWLKPRWTLAGRLFLQEASPNRFFDRVVQYHFHGSLNFKILDAANPGKTVFEYSAQRVGMHSDRSTAAMEWASRKLFLLVLKDAALYECPELAPGQARPTPTADAVPQLDIHRPLPPLFDSRADENPQQLSQEASEDGAPRAPAPAPAAPPPPGPQVRVIDVKQIFLKCAATAAGRALLVEQSELGAAKLAAVSDEIKAIEARAALLNPESPERVKLGEQVFQMRYQQIADKELFEMELEQKETDLIRGVYLQILNAVAAYAAENQLVAVLSVEFGTPLAAAAGANGTPPNVQVQTTYGDVLYYSTRIDITEVILQTMDAKAAPR